MDKAKLIKILEPFEKRHDLKDAVIRFRLNPVSAEKNIDQILDKYYATANEEIFSLISESKFSEKAWVKIQTGGGPFPTKTEIFPLSKAFIDHVILYESALNSVEKLVQALEREMDDKFTNFIFSGLKLSRKITLEKGWKIVPYTKMSLVEKCLVQDLFENLRLRGIFSSKAVDISEFGFCSLSLERKNQKLFIKKDAGLEGKFGFKDETLPIGFIHLLNALNDSPVILHWLSSRFSEDNPFYLISSFNRGFLNDFKPFHSIKRIYEYAPEEFKQKFLMFSKLSKKNQRALGLISKRLLHSFSRRYLEDRILELGIALEMLLLNDLDHQELRYRLSQRGAWILSPLDFDERKQTEANLKTFYDFRSKVVHTGEIPSKDYNEAFRVLDAASTMCTILILKILEQGKFPSAQDWSEITLGKKLT